MPFSAGNRHRGALPGHTRYGKWLQWSGCEHKYHQLRNGPERPDRRLCNLAAESRDAVAHGFHRQSQRRRIPLRKRCSPRLSSFRREDRPASLSTSPFVGDGLRWRLNGGYSRVPAFRNRIFNPPPPVPLLQFDSGAPAGGQQRTLTMSLPTPSPIAASGSVRLSFQPSTSVVADDSAVVFVATGTRSVPFSIKAGDTQFLLGGQPGAVFQTGTTPGP